MSSNNGQPRSFARCLVITITATAVALVTIIGIIYLLGRFAFHDPPGFSVTNFYFDNSFNGVVADLAIRNYNSKTRISYHSISVMFSYGGNQFATVTVAPFDQGKDATTEVEARFQIPNRVSQCGFDRPFGLKVSMIVRYVDIRKVKALSVSCDDIWVGCLNGTTASMLGTGKLCTVHE